MKKYILEEKKSLFSILKIYRFLWRCLRSQIFGGNFQLIGHVTRLITCNDSSSSHFSTEEKLNFVFVQNGFLLALTKVANSWRRL